MRLLLVHISDIHLTGNADRVFGKRGKIVEAVRNLDYELDGCVLVLSGDIAYGGKAEEYLAALEFTEGLKAKLHLDLPGKPRIDCVVIPGNHDCDLVPESRARSELLRHVGQQNGEPVDSSILQLCAKVQDEFFGFRDAVASEGLVNSERLYYEYQFQVRGESVRFRCYNTAWASRIPEVEGSLYFPMERVTDTVQNAELSVSVFHHPYRWLPQHNYRQFRSNVEGSSQLVLTGHEHEPGRRFERSDTGEVNQYIEGVALQTAFDSDESAFNALVIDSNRAKQRFYRFVWNGELYQRNEQPDSQDEWEDLQVNRLRSKSAFAISDAMSAVLDDPGVGIAGPEGTNLRLSDIFLLPDLREVFLRKRDVQPLIRGEEVLQLLAEEQHVLITGPEQSGKTSLAKRLFIEFHNLGAIPLYIDGSAFKAGAADKMVRDFDKLFTRQYGEASLEQFRQIDRQRRVLIIDDSHKIQLQGRTALDDVLNFMAEFAGKIVLLANDLAQQLNELIDSRRSAQDRIQFRHFRIQQFGHAKRDELVEKWYLLDRTYVEDDARLASQLISAKQTLDVMLGKNYVPAFPVFILSILQARGAATPLNLNASTYGYFFELLIKQSLAIGSSRISYDIKTTYLATVAYAMFRTNRLEIGEDDLREVTQQFAVKKALEIPFNSMRDDLIAGKIWTRLGDAFWFRYKYVYYYFVASYLRDAISTSEVQGVITNLSQSLDNEDNANILVFLAHLSKDPFIVREMVRSAREVFKQLSPVQLGADVAFLTTADSKLIDVVYRDMNVRDSRREMLKRMDEADEMRTSLEHRVAAREAGEAEWREHQQWLTQLNVAFKTLQILGQILKNFPASLDAPEKEEIALESYELGLRTLNAVLNVARENREEILRFYVEVIRAEQSAPQDVPLDSSERKDLLEQAHRSLFGLALSATYGTIQRIAYAVGSPALGMTYASVLERNPTEAIKLIDLALRLDQSGKFPMARIDTLGEELTSKPLAWSVLRHLVVNHFYLFGEELPVRQKACQILKIPMDRILARGHKGRLVAPERKAD